MWLDVGPSRALNDVISINSTIFNLLKAKKAASFCFLWQHCALRYYRAKNGFAVSLAGRSCMTWPRMGRATGVTRQHDGRQSPPIQPPDITFGSLVS